MLKTWRFRIWVYCPRVFNEDPILFSIYSHLNCIRFMVSFSIVLNDRISVRRIMHTRLFRNSVQIMQIRETHRQSSIRIISHIVTFRVYSGMVRRIRSSISESIPEIYRIGTVFSIISLRISMLMHCNNKILWFSIRFTILYNHHFHSYSPGSHNFRNFIS